MRFWCHKNENWHCWSRFSKQLMQSRMELRFGLWLVYKIISFWIPWLQCNSSKYWNSRFGYILFSWLLHHLYLISSETNKLLRYWKEIIVLETNFLIVMLWVYFVKHFELSQYIDITSNMSCFLRFLELSWKMKHWGQHNTELAEQFEVRSTFCTDILKDW